MLTLEYIKENTLWVAKFEGGIRKTGTQSEIEKYEDQEDFECSDIICWEGQPKDLQEFHRDFDYAVYTLKRDDLFFVDDFYREWSKNPDQFKPGKLPVIGKLYEMLSNMDPCNDLIIENYDERTAGNHHIGNFIEALQVLETDFDVVKFHESSGDEYDYAKITIQTDDTDLFRNFSYQSNRIALAHDKFLGDGKYCKR